MSVDEPKKDCPEAPGKPCDTASGEDTEIHAGDLGTIKPGSRVEIGGEMFLFASIRTCARCGGCVAFWCRERDLIPSLSDLLVKPVLELAPEEPLKDWDRLARRWGGARD